jgi:uncharacterized LabA/DUF88 family protein
VSGSRHTPGFFFVTHWGINSYGDRAVLFVDGNNWYHGLKEIGVWDQRTLDFAKISQKLAGPRRWYGTRYYIGRVRQNDSAKLYAAQREFLAALQATDRRISVHLGRLEPRPARNEMAKELLRYLAELQIRLPETVYQDLVAMGRRHETMTVMVEKAVDVHLAVDMVAMAQRSEYDAAYLLSADGDFTPAVAAVRELGKKVYAAAATPGAKLAAVVDAFIPIDRAWVADCRRA